MPYRTKEEQREYQKNWVRSRRLIWLEENGPCRECGSREKLEVDHVDPNEKEMEPASIWSRRKEVREKELAKCQVLCEACHLAKTSKGWNETHGLRGYNRGCRCEICKETKRVQNGKRKIKGWR